MDVAGRPLTVCARSDHPVQSQEPDVSPCNFPSTPAPQGPALNSHIPLILHTAVLMCYRGEPLTVAHATATESECLQQQTGVCYFVLVTLDHGRADGGLLPSGENKRENRGPFLLLGPWSPAGLPLLGFPPGPWGNTAWFCEEGALGCLGFLKQEPVYSSGALTRHTGQVFQMVTVFYGHLLICQGPSEEHSGCWTGSAAGDGLGLGIRLSECSEHISLQHRAAPNPPEKSSCRCRGKEQPQAAVGCSGFCGCLSVARF